MLKVNPEDWNDISDLNPDVISTKKGIYKKVFEVGENKIFLGKELSTNNKCLMFLATRDNYQEKDRPFSETEGLEVRFDIFRNDDNKDGVLLKLTKDDYLEVFIALANNILDVVTEIKQEKPFVETFFNQLAVWKHFLKNAGKRGLGPDRRRGLFGELHFVKEVLVPEFGKDGVKYWVGPNPAIHDIEVGKGAIEVKTSAGNKSQSIVISNERQLDDDGYEKLFLYHVAMTVRKNSNPNLVDIIGEIREMLRDDHQNYIIFNNQLTKSGYNDIHNDYYIGEGYHVDEVNYFHVREGFPRIIGDDIQDGIGGLKYKVDVSACTDFKVTEDEFKTFIDLIK